MSVLQRYREVLEIDDRTFELSPAYFSSYLSYYQEHLTDHDMFNLTLSLYLLTTGLHRCICPPFDLEVCPPYHPAQRLIFRQVVQTFFKAVSPTFLCNCAEQVVAELLQERHATVKPDLLVEQVTALGPEEYHKQATRNMVLQRFVGHIASVVTSNPSHTHKPLTYQYEGLVEKPSASVLLAVSGWTSRDDNARQSWRGLLQFPGSVYHLRWEAGTFGTIARDAILKVAGMSGSAASVATGLSGSVASAAVVEGAEVAATGCSVSASVLAGGAISLGVVAAVASVIAGAGVISFHSDCKNAAATGRKLATNIKAAAFGQFPVSLIGFSLGCRVIYYCLKELAQDSSRCYIQDVILLGGAAKNDPILWNRLLSAVTGRAVNVYSRKDKVLKIAYKIAMMGKPPVGLGPVLCARMENYDASAYVKSHQDHRQYLEATLLRIGYLA